MACFVRILVTVVPTVLRVSPDPGSAVMRRMVLVSGSWVLGRFITPVVLIVVPMTGTTRGHVRFMLL